MEIKRSGSQPSGKGPAEYFTGTVRIDPLFQAPDPAASSARASRSSRAPGRPGTRTRSGQTLIVTAGSGRAQRWGGPIEEIRPGDVIWFAPGEKHWHGAAPDDGHDAHRHSGTARRQGRRLDGDRSAPTAP